MVEKWQFEMNCLPYNLAIININAPTLAATRTAEFFEGSAEKMLSTLLGSEGAKLSEEELQRLAQLIDKARKAGPR